MRTRRPGASHLPLDGLHKLSAAVNRAERQEQVYEAAIEALTCSLFADRASILLFDSESVMRFVAWQGLSDEYRKAVEGHSPWTAESVDPQPILVEEIDLDSDLAPFRDTIHKEGICSLAFIPLLYRSKLLGKFMVYFDRPHAFSDEERLMAQTIANHVAFAIEQKRGENSLLRYRKVFESAPTGIGILDLGGRYLEQNPAHRDLIGYSDEEIVNYTPAVHMGDERFAELVDGLQKHDKFLSELDLTTKDGKKLQIELSAYTVRDEDGHPICYVGLKHDITERKEAETRIQQINQELEHRVEARTLELQKAKDEMEGFCYSVSHDLRGPLRGVSAAAMMLLEDYPDRLDDVGKGHLTRMAAGCSRLGRLIDDLLQYSRLGRKEPVRTSVDLSAIAARTADELRKREFADKSLDLRIGKVPAAKADPQFMEIVLYNLLENACKFAGGKPEPVVEFGCTVDGNRKVYFVRDNGVGFDPQYSGKLFRPFERLHTEAEFPGTGIGLANVKRIIDRHGGQIWCEAEEGKGATFFFTLA